jgi:hypothetical protein
MFGRAAMIVTMLVLIAMVPATATATPRDVAAAHAYIQANYALARASEAKIGEVEAKVKTFTRRLGRECPNVGAGSPQNAGSQPLSYEAAVALWSISYRADAGPIDAFANAVRRLRWSNRRLARIAQRYATNLHALATLPLPNLCGDVSAWKTSGFKTVPGTTTRVDRHVEAIMTRTIPPSLLAPYEQPTDRAIVTRTVHLETKLEQAETGVGFDDWAAMLETLGVSQ